MIDVKELMVGNYIQVVGGLGNDYIEEVISINDNFIGLSNSNTESNPQFHCDVDVPIEEVYGVPLSEEILLKCGFKELGKYTFYKGSFKIHKRKRGFVIRKSIPIIDYLHQLQMAYKVFTGKEFEIKW